MTLQINESELRYLATGLLLGCVLTNSYVILIPIIIYLSAILIIRCGISLILLFGNDILYKEINNCIGKNIFNATDFVFEYNLFDNILKIRRSWKIKIISKIITNEEIIRCEIRNIYNQILFFDIFYHMFPLKIVFE